MGILKVLIFLGFLFFSNVIAQENEFSSLTPTSTPIAPLQLEKAKATAFPFGIETSIKFSGKVEVQWNWSAKKSLFRFFPCRLSSTFPKKVEYPEFKLILKAKEKEDSKAQWSCFIQLVTGTPYYSFRQNWQEAVFQISLYPTQKEFEIFEAIETLKKGKIFSQSDLRESTQILAKYLDSPQARETIDHSLEQGPWALKLACVYGLCQNYRFGYLEKLQNLRLLQQLSQTPDQKWLDHCLSRFHMLSDLEKILKEKGEKRLEDFPVKPSELEPLVLVSGTPGRLASRYFRYLLGQESTDPELSRRLRFLLFLYEGLQEDFQKQLTEIDLLLDDPDFKELEIVFLGIENEEEVERISFRANPINMRFFKGELFRDQFKDYEKALKIFNNLSKLPDHEAYLSIQATPSGFLKPASVAALEEMAETHYYMGEVKEACSQWADLAWKRAGAYIVGMEGRQSYCEYCLKKLKEFCPNSFQNLLKKRTKGFQKTPEECQIRWDSLLEEKADETSENLF